MLAGVFVFAVAQIALAPWDIYLKERELLIVAGVILGLGVLAFSLGRIKKKGKSQKLTDTMEKITSIVSK